MRGMAGKTPLLTRHRGMLERDLLALFFVAIDAEAVHPFLFEPRMLGRMRGVAGQTLAFLKRVMLDRPARFQLRSIVTIVAELTPCFRSGKRFWIRCRLMACVTLGRGHRFVGTRFQKLGF